MHWQLQCFFLGLIWGFRKQKAVLIYLIIPLLLAILASGFHFYSTIPRLMLFTAPALIILVVKGLEFIHTQLNVIPSKIQWQYTAHLFASLLLLQGFLNTAIHNMSGIEIGEVKIPIEFLIAHKQQDDYLYLFEMAKPAIRYYKDKYDFTSLKLLPGTPSYQNWKKDFEQVKNKLGALTKALGEAEKI